MALKAYNIYYVALSKKKKKRFGDLYLRKNSGFLLKSSTYTESKFALLMAL